MKLLKKLTQGFTMIELLIVIAVLGILAVAVLAAINPIEQINRGKDTGSRSDAEQLSSAMDRFYASKGYYPWTTGASDTNTSTYGAGVAAMTKLNSSTVGVGGDTPLQQPLQNLSVGGTSELKASFITRIADPAYNFLSLYNDGTSGHSTYVCFVPKSSSFRDEAWKRCTGTLPADFPASACPVGATCTTAATADAATGCYICLP